MEQSARSQPNVAARTRPSNSPAADPCGELTALLLHWRQGCPSALSEIIPLAYDDLRRLAQAQVNSEAGLLTLQATEVLHETYLRLADKRNPRWRDRKHFFAVASLIMRRIRIDRARRRAAPRHGGGATRIELEDRSAATTIEPDDPIDLVRAINRLAALDARRAQVVAMRHFGGFSLDETAELLGVSQATVVRDWRLARAWLLRQLRLSPRARG